MISQGGLDGFDDSLLSSSADSSYDETDNELDSKVSKNQQSFQNEMNEVMMNQQQQKQQQQQTNQPVPSPRNNTHTAEPVPELNHKENGGDEHDESLFAHNLDQTAPPMNNQRDANFML